MPRPKVASKKAAATQTEAGVFSSSRRGSLAACGLLALVGIAIYSNSFDAPFVFDGKFLLNDDSLRHIWPWKFSSGRNRPIGMLSFGLNYALCEYRVWGYHAVNLAIHVAAACVLFGVVRRTLAGGRLQPRYGGACWGLALATALIWLAHPLQTESVTYIYQRLEALMGLFYLLTLYCFLRAQDSSRPRLWYAASVICCALGMGTKEVTVTAPLLVLWYDRVFVASSWRQMVSQRAKYYLALAGTWAILAYLIVASAAKYAAIGIEQIGPLDYAQSQPGVILHYLRLCFWPSDLCLDYLWQVPRTASEIAPAWLAILALLGGTIWCMFQRPMWGFALGCCFLILAPTSSVSPIIDLAFEHRMYLPLAPVVVVVVILAYELMQWLLGRLSTAETGGKRLARFVPAIVTAAIVSALGFRTFSRNVDYRTELSIWEDTLSKRPQSSRAWIYRGAAYLDLGQTEQAVRDCSQALEMNPNPVDGYLVRGDAYSRLGKNDLALADYSKAIQIKPSLATSYYHRGLIYQAQDRLQEALDDFNAALRYNPDYAAVYNSRSGLYGLMGKYEQAIADTDMTIKFNPNYPSAYVNRGNAHRRLGQLTVALDDFSRAIELDPKSAEACFERGTVYLLLKDYDQAIRDFSKAAELKPDDVRVYNNRAICWYNQKQFDRAWDDVRQCEKLGGHPAKGFLEALKKASRAKGVRDRPPAHDAAP